MGSYDLYNMFSTLLPFLFLIGVYVFLMWRLKPQVKRNKIFMEETSVSSKRQADALERIAIALEKMDGK
jgi:preprotein translocase subunit YajC